MGFYIGLWKRAKCGLVAGGVNKPLVWVCSKGGGHRWTANNSTMLKRRNITWL